MRKKLWFATNNMKQTHLDLLIHLAGIKQLLLHLGLFQECKRSFNSLEATINRLLEKEQ